MSVLIERIAGEAAPRKGWGGRQFRLDEKKGQPARGDEVAPLVSADATHANPSSVRGVEPGSHRGRWKSGVSIPGACMETEASGMPRSETRACTYGAPFFYP